MTYDLIVTLREGSRDSAAAVASYLLHEGQKRPGYIQNPTANFPSINPEAARPRHYATLRFDSLSNIAANIFHKHMAEDLEALGYSGTVTLVPVH